MCQFVSSKENEGRAVNGLDYKYYTSIGVTDIDKRATLLQPKRPFSKGILVGKKFNGFFCINLQ
jgi:hypothetical protein